MMQCVGEELNAANTFLVYMATISANSKVRLLLYVLLFSSCVMDVNMQIYWAHVYDPLVFHPVTWWDLEIPISRNNSKMLGEEQLPPSGSLTNGTDWLSVEGNQTFVADSYVLCLTTCNDSTCTPLTLHMHLKKSISKRTMLQAIEIPGVNTLHNSKNTTTAPNNISICKLKVFSPSVHFMFSMQDGKS